MSRPKKSIELQDLIDPSLDQDQISGAMTQMRQDAREDLADLCDLAGDVGAIRALDLTSKFVAAATVQIFQRVRESKQINNLPIRMLDGSVATATNIDEFCKLVFGKPRTSMVEASETLDALGNDAYELANRLGLNRNALRAARALPPGQLEIVRAAIATGSSKSEVLSVIEDLAMKGQEATATTEDVRAELEAERELSGKKTQKIEQLKRDKIRINKLPPEEALIELRKEATTIALDSEASILGGMRQAFIALSEHDGEDNMIFMAGLAGQVQRRLSELREEFDLPDLSNAADAELAGQVAQWATGEVKSVKGSKTAKA